ncbi:MAG: hypothetical protein KH921_21095 [Erysipelotrichaceae bacterium]|nr:hypothetical protein [Erysipelotrichaceae bacterium]
MKRKTIMRAVILCVGILYFGAVAVATVYAETEHRKNLPVAKIAMPTDGKLPVSIMKRNSDNQYYVDSIEQEDGPWGKRYLVKQTVLVNFRYLDEETIVVFGNTIIDAPIVFSSSQPLYTGMEVYLTE